MKYETAKELLLSEGYRIVSEDFEDDAVYDDVVDTNQEALPAEGEEQLDSDVYGAVEQGLGDEGFDAQEVADIMTANNERIDELSQKGVAAEDIVKILAYENCECEGQNPEDFGDETVDETGVEYDDVPVDEAYMTEGKSKPKGDKFSHKEKVAGRKPKGCCGGKKGGKCTDDDDDDLDESYLDEGILQSIKDRWQDRKVLKRGEKHDKWLKQNAHKVYQYDDGSVENVRNILKAVRGLKCTEEDIAKAKKLNIEDLNSVLKDIDLEQAPGYGIYNDGSKYWWENNPKCKYISDILRFVLQKELDDEVKTHGAEIDEAYDDTFREPRGQVGTDNWDDFKEDFRAKTLFLKKALTPAFVSGIIKDTDFEVDDKEIKAYAFTVIEDVFGTKDPVRNLQARIRNHFVK